MKSQFGIGFIGAVLIIFTVGLTGIAGWIVWDRQNNPGTSPQSQNTSQVSNKKTSSVNANIASETGTLVDGEVKKLDPLTIASISDISKLPSYTPTSFKDLINNDFKTEQGCTDNGTLNFVVNVISLDTIAGSRFYCGEGSSVVWSLTESGKWITVRAQDACTAENNGTKIPSSFMKNAMHDTCSAFTDTKY